MDLFSMALFITVYIYAFLYSSFLLKILMFNIIVYTIVSIYISLKNDVSVKSKILLSFYKNFSYSAVLGSIDINMEKIENFK